MTKHLNLGTSGIYSSCSKSLPGIASRPFG